MPEVHAEITPFKAIVQEKYLYDMDETRNGLIKCNVIGVSSYPGHMLTFTIHIPETGGIFCYIPIHALKSHRWLCASPIFEPNQLQIFNCPDAHISVTSYEYLRDRKVVGFFRNDGPKPFVSKMTGKYLFSVDWYKLNELVNVIELDNSQFCALPPYRTLYGVDLDANLPDYKALHPEWRV